MKKIYVLMSTFNGERYISEQISSVLNQKNVDVELFIRDDGSTDSTVPIVESMKKMDSRIHLYVEKNIGVKYSFLTLLKSVDLHADYYAFCDQDDYWLDNKLYEAITKIERNSSCHVPTLYYSYTTLVDQDLNVIQSKNPYNKVKSYDFGQIMVKNCASGCTMVLNRALKSVISKKDIMGLLATPLHDHWVYMVCRAINGNVIFDNRSFILYRQHSANVIGGQRTLWKKIINSPMFRGGNIRLLWAQQLFEQYEDDIIGANKNILCNIVSYKESLCNTLRFAFDTNVKPPELFEKIVVALTILRRGY